MANMSLPVRVNPRVTTSAIVDVMTAPAYRLVSILKPQKYPPSGPVFGYKGCRGQLLEFIAAGTPLQLGDPSLRDYEVEALKAASALPDFPNLLLPQGTTSARVFQPASSQTWNEAGVEISFFPDLILKRVVGRNETPSTGALKLYLRKDPLTVGPQLASLLFYYRSQIEKDPNVDPSLCAVADVQAGVVYVASGSYQRLLGQVRSACQVVAAMWSSL